MSYIEDARYLKVNSMLYIDCLFRSVGRNVSEMITQRRAKPTVAISSNVFLT